MNLSIQDKNAFVNSFLTPISKVTNSAVIKAEGDIFSSLIATNDNTIILNSTFKNHTKVEDTCLNIPDLNKLIRILTVIDSSSIASYNLWQLSPIILANFFK